MNHYLSIILFTPLAGALILLLVNKQNESAIKWIANIVAFAGFAISVPLWFWYNPGNPDFQFVERATVNKDGRLTEGPATSSATAAPTGAPDASRIRASGISKNVGNASGTATAATTATERILAPGEANVCDGII